MTTNHSLLDLPVELLLEILHNLDVRSFLDVTATCKGLRSPAFTQDSTYWSNAIRSTFRVPNQPVARNDGLRWQKLYKRMSTQSRVYTWGADEEGSLGQNLDPPTVRRGARVFQKRSYSPQQMQFTKLSAQSSGQVADVQCGGWSTTLLEVGGSLRTWGIIDGQDFQQRGYPPPNGAALQYPTGFPHPSTRQAGTLDVSTTAIKQLSVGRAHILGLSDSGRIWSWTDAKRPAVHVTFMLHDVVERGNAGGHGLVKKVVAGWSKSAALIEGSGIVVWEPVRASINATDFQDSALVLQSAVVPHTGASPTDVASFGRVVNFVVLEQTVVFNTDSGRVFAAEMLWSADECRVTDPVELRPESEESEDGAFATDVQGSFHNFAIFTRSGAVLTCKQDRVMRLLRDETPSTALVSLIPALQRRDVIQLAFGDHHFHALHANGTITSFGTEPQSCGALGLGEAYASRLRGVRPRGLVRDGTLLPHAYSEGRRIWFAPEKHSWSRFLLSGGADPAEARVRMAMCLGTPRTGDPDLQCQGELSEWIEQQSRDWESKYVLHSEDDDGLGAHFAMSVTAAGWHSAALVLVNEELAERLKNACEIAAPTVLDSERNSANESTVAEEGKFYPTTFTTRLLNSALATISDYGRWFLGLPPYGAASTRATDFSTLPLRDDSHTRHRLETARSPRDGVDYVWADEHFPRLMLDDGREMPGSVPFDTWKYPKPEWDLDFIL